mmetsp:Transcript_66641/g.192517  ORF Transcript_66641/g.192517 Transcript_66641/m.192517 type:complete len:201 (-) Transcript_66641:653-1255(-)
MPLSIKGLSKYSASSKPMAALAISCTAPMTISGSRPFGFTATSEAAAAAGAASPPAGAAWIATAPGATEPPATRRAIPNSWKTWYVRSLPPSSSNRWKISKASCAVWEIHSDLGSILWYACARTSNVSASKCSFFTFCERYLALLAASRPLCSLPLKMSIVRETQCKACARKPRSSTSSVSFSTSPLAEKDFAARSSISF